MFSYSQCGFLAFHSVSADYFRIIWLAVAVAAKGTLVAGVVAAETVADVALCIMGTILVAGVMHKTDPACHAMAGGKSE